MNMKKFWKETKHMLALVLAFALFFIGDNSNVTGSCSSSFEIESKTITSEMVTISPESAIVNGENHSSEINVVVKEVVSGTELTKDSDYTLVVPAEIRNQGIYAVKVSGIGNYNGDVTKTFTLSYATNGTVSLEGNTVEDKIYADTVAIRPEAGYQISEEPEGTYEDTITYTLTPSDFVVYLKNATTNEVTKCELPAFTVDTEAPVFNQVTVSVVDSDWAALKEIVLDVSGADYIYYTTAEASLGNLISEKPTGMTQLQGNTLQVKENISAETTYYFYAIDKAGHVASVEAKVSKVDIDGPIISVNHAMDNFVDEVYWKNANNLEIPVKVTDNLSGIESIEVTGSGNLEYTISEDKLSADGTLTITEAGTYTITATDKAGTEATKTINVKQDTVAPEIILSEPTGENMYLDTINQVYWFSGANVMVSLNITDALGTDETEKAPYTVIYATSEDMLNPTEVTVNDNAGKVSVTVGTETTYYFQVADKAGNKGTIQSVALAYDDSKPEITAAELTQLNGDAWINAVEFGGENSEHKVAFSVTASDAGSGIKKIEYSSDNGQNYTEASFKEENGIYTFVTNEEYADSTNYQWKVRVINNVGKNSDVWTFVDAEGNNLGQIDTAAPSATAYIRFLSDTAGANGTNDGEAADGKWSSQILKMTSHTWNNIWGKTAINFEVYIKDETSGIDSIEMSFNGNKIEGLKKEEGLQAFVTGDLQSKEGYTLYTGEITCQKNSVLTVQNFQIDKLTDVAGNVNQQPIVLNDAVDTEIIYLDSVAPMLSIVNGSKNVDINDKYFYKDEQTITLTIEERFFEEKDKPNVILMRREGVESAFKEVEPVEGNQSLVSDWMRVADTYEWQTTVTLPAVAGAENEYQIVLDEYEDSSGNKLVDYNNKEIINGFASKIFVVDMLAPKLTDYSVIPTTKCTVDNAEVRKSDTAPGYNDLSVSFEFDDNETYYEVSNGNLVVNLYKKGIKETELVKTLKVGDKDLTVTHDANGRRVYRCSFEYDGEADTEDQFYVEIGYEDAAGNLMIDGREKSEEGDNPGTLNDGVYRSKNYIIDHVAPVFNVEYSDAENVVDSDGKNAKKDDVDVKQPSANDTAYYKDNIDVKLIFAEKYTHIKDDQSLEHYDLKLYKDGAEEPLTDKALRKVIPNGVSWKHDSHNNVHTAEFQIAADKINHETDGNYQFVVTYRDCAENLMVTENEEVQKLLKDGIYTSPVLVMDTTAPKVTTTYTSKVAQTYDHGDHSRDYFNTTTGFNITVVDRNIRYSDLITKLHDEFTAQNIKNESLKDAVKVIRDSLNEITAKDQKIQCVNGNVTDPGRITWKVEIPLTEEANYNLPVYFTDLAGNVAQVTPAGAENPVEEGYIEYVTVDSHEPGFNLSYSVTDPANYLKWGYWFAKGQMNIKVTATDEISGVWYIKFTVYDENEKVIDERRSNDFKLDKADKTQFSIDIPLSTRDFKGSIKAEVFDYSINENYKIRGHIVESAEKHSATGKAVIQTITSPSRNVGGVDFYNTDVKFKLTLEDTYSGLASWKYVGGDTLENTHSYKKDAGTDMEKDPTQEIIYSYEEELTLSASGNNKNDVLVTASYEDNVGHTNEVEQKYNIDITKPEIEVTYDLNEPANGKYYKDTRTATVKIRERNFDPADVEFLITSTDGPKPEISGWSSSGTGDNTYHTCTVAFSQDSDYTFTLKFQDMAGNVADYNRVDEFTIDKTIPEATITYDNNQFLNEYYYDAARTATIDILEHNFDPTAIDIMVTADGGTAGVPHISAWSSNGDHNIATITFSADAEYTFDIAGLDLALNELEDYTPDHFVIDQTAPELEIFDIENMSANNGVVRPGIRYYDTNYDKDGTVIQMTGYHNGVVEMTGDRRLEANGLELKLNDFEYVQEMDDIYTMEATVYDLAGNSSEETVMFSVNRFGSVYTFDEKTDALIGDHGKYYTNKEQELVITETNVDTLEFKEITCNLNGKLATLKEGEDYTVSLNGNEATWKQYTYKLKEDNFKEEGTYILTIYSEDRATNTSDNSSKGKKIEFVVDKTNPSVLISGVENNGQYRTNSREMTLDIEDNVRLSEVAVTIDGTETVYDAAQIQEADGKFVMNIGSANHWQDIEIAVTDAAGNKEIPEEMRVLVTANIFVQYFMNKPVFYGSLGTLAATAALLWWFLVEKKNKVTKKD